MVSGEIVCVAELGEDEEFLDIELGAAVVAEGVVGDTVDGVLGVVCVEIHDGDGRGSCLRMVTVRVYSAIEEYWLKRKLMKPIRL